MIEESMPKVSGKCDDCGELLVRRSDDNSETFGKRYDVYYENTAPLISYYEEKGILYKVDSGMSKDVVFSNIESILDNLSN
jgi:adenylate kinase